MDYYSIKIRKLKKKGLDNKYIKIFINLLEYIQKIQYNTDLYGGNIMKEILNILLDFIISYTLIFILYYFFFVFKKTKYNKKKVPVEYYYLVRVYGLDEKKINYKKFLYTSAIINTFIIALTYVIVFHLLDNWLWQLLCSIILIILLIIIMYGILGRHYQKRGKKNV